MIPTKVRQAVYIAAAVLAAVIAGVIVWSGFITEDEVMEWGRLALAIFGVFVPVLALVNIKKDEPSEE